MQLLLKKGKMITLSLLFGKHELMDCAVLWQFGHGGEFGRIPHLTAPSNAYVTNIFILFCLNFLFFELLKKDLFLGRCRYVYVADI